MSLAQARTARGPGRRSEARSMVVYIGGSGRSGSTLLERILGQMDGVCAVGEVVHLWTRGVIGNELCGCGASFHECPFWREVGRSAFGGWEAVDPLAVVRLERSVSRHRFIPLMLAAPPSSAYRRRLAGYRELQGRLYRGIAAAAGGGTVVDSSKSAPYAFALAEVAGVNLRVIHLVRDSRGVAHSLRKRVIRPEVTTAVRYMPTYHPARAGVEWAVDNALFHSLASRGVPSRLVQYEELVRRPREVTQALLSFLPGVDPDHDLSFVGTDKVLLRPTHSVAGNPMRFQQGGVELRPDEEWRRRMAARDRLLVSALTWPLLARYGYRRVGW